MIIEHAINRILFPRHHDQLQIHQTFLFDMQTGDALGRSCCVDEIRLEFAVNAQDVKKHHLFAAIKLCALFNQYRPKNG